MEGEWGVKRWNLTDFGGDVFEGHVSRSRFPKSIHGCMVYLGGGNSNIFFNVHPHLGKIPILTSIFFKWVETTN